MTMESGAVAAWLKRDGEAVQAGEALFTVETDEDAPGGHAHAPAPPIRTDPQPLRIDPGFHEAATIRGRGTADDDAGTLVVHRVGVAPVRPRPSRETGPDEQQTSCKRA